LNQVCKTFPDALHNSPAYDIINAEQKWLTCPCCGKRLLKVLPDTSARNLLLFCRKCKAETLVNIPTQPES
jgi:hypothetical protein